jgi:hypothetical protein
VAWYYFLLNDLPNAAVHAERGVQIPFETGMPFGEANSRILLAYVFREKGDPKKAFEQIEMARKIGRRQKAHCSNGSVILPMPRWRSKRGKRNLVLNLSKGLWPLVVQKV